MEKGADDSESEPDHDRIAEAQKGAAEAASFLLYRKFRFWIRGKRTPVDRTYVRSTGE